MGGWLLSALELRAVELGGWGSYCRASFRAQERPRSRGQDGQVDGGVSGLTRARRELPSGVALQIAGDLPRTRPSRHGPCHKGPRSHATCSLRAEGLAIEDMKRTRTPSRQCTLG